MNDLRGNSVCEWFPVRPILGLLLICGLNLATDAFGQPGSPQAPKTANVAPRPNPSPSTPPLKNSKPAPPTSSEIEPSAPTREERRVRVNDRSGKSVVARYYCTIEGKPLIMLPDGQLGVPTQLIDTPDPFVPGTFKEVEANLSAYEFKDFDVVHKPHYLIFTKGSESYTKAASKLLEDLYSELYAKLSKSGFSVHPPEFPLVAVIFKTEAEFRKFKPIDRDVQAYYDILSNRIYMFDVAGFEAMAPEVAAMRKPQTVAHEGAHQILHNIGIQPRLAPWPIWVIEGLAEYCSPPTITKNGQTNWGGLGQVNAQHRATISDIVDGTNASLSVLARSPDKPMVMSLVSAKQLTPTDYALAWGLTHYLATRKNSDFLKYLKMLGLLEPGTSLTPEQQLADFQSIFGKDLFGIDRQVIKHLSKLKVKEGEYLPYYAVMIEHKEARQVKRFGMVSQSSSMIREWVDKMSRGANQTWRIEKFPTKGNATIRINAFVSGT